MIFSIPPRNRVGSRYLHAISLLPLAMSLFTGMFSAGAYGEMTYEQAMEDMRARVDGRKPLFSVAPGLAWSLRALRSSDAKVRRDGCVWLQQNAPILGRHGRITPEERARLQRDPYAQAVDPLLGALKDTDAAVRCWAARALGPIVGSFSSARMVEPLIAASGDIDGKVRNAAAAALANALAALGVAADARTVDPLIVALADTDGGVRMRAASLLGGSKDARAVEPLIAMLQDPDNAVRMGAVGALDKLEDAEAAGPRIAAFRAAMDARPVETVLRASKVVGLTIAQSSWLPVGTPDSVRSLVERRLAVYDISVMDTDSMFIPQIAVRVSGRGLKKEYKVQTDDKFLAAMASPVELVTGADVSGTIEIVVNGSSKASRSFSHTVSPPEDFLIRRSEDVKRYGSGVGRAAAASALRSGFEPVFEQLMTQMMGR